MGINGPGQLTERLQSTASGPGAPVAEISDGIVCRLQVEILESQLQLVGLGCLQVLAAELIQLFLLAAAEVSRVLQPQVTASLVGAGLKPAPTRELSALAGELGPRLR